MRAGRRNRKSIKYLAAVILSVCLLGQTVWGAPGACLGNYDGNAASQGEVRMLVMLVGFADHSFEGRTDLIGGSYEQFETGVADSLFGTGDFSLTTMMKRASNDLLRVDGDVIKVTLPVSRMAYEQEINTAWESYQNWLQSQAAALAAEAGLVTGPDGRTVYDGALAAGAAIAAGETYAYDDEDGEIEYEDDEYDDSEDWDDSSDEDYGSDSEDIDDSENVASDEGEYMTEEELAAEGVALEVYADGNAIPQESYAGSGDYFVSNKPLKNHRDKSVTESGTSAYAAYEPMTESEAGSYVAYNAVMESGTSGCATYAAKPESVTNAHVTYEPMTASGMLVGEEAVNEITRVFIRMMQDALDQAVAEGKLSPEELKTLYVNKDGYITPVAMLPQTEGVLYPEAWRGCTITCSPKKEYLQTTVEAGTTGEGSENMSLPAGTDGITGGIDGTEPGTEVVPENYQLGQLIVCDDMPLTGPNAYGEDYTGLFLGTMVHEFGHTMGLPDLYTETAFVWLPDEDLWEDNDGDDLDSDDEEGWDEPDVEEYWDDDDPEEDWDEADDWEDPEENDWEEDDADGTENTAEGAGAGHPAADNEPDVPVTVLMYSSNGDFSAFSKLMLNWITREQTEIVKPTGDPVTIRLSSAQKTEGIRAIMIPRDVTVEDPFNGEYILIEYDTDNGNIAAWNAIHPDQLLSGVRLMHVDGTMGVAEDSCRNLMFIYENDTEAAAQGHHLISFYRDGKPCSTGAVITSVDPNTQTEEEGFCWYDEEGDEEVPVGVTVTVGEMTPDYCDITLSVG